MAPKRCHPLGPKRPVKLDERSDESNHKYDTRDSSANRAAVWLIRGGAYIPVVSAVQILSECPSTFHSHLLCPIILRARGFLLNSSMRPRHHHRPRRSLALLPRTTYSSLRLQSHHHTITLETVYWCMHFATDTYSRSIAAAPDLPWIRRARQTHLPPSGS